MAEVERKKQEKKIVLRIHGGIAGLLVVSGAIAVAALVSVLKNRSNRRPRNGLTKNPPTKPLKEVNCTKKDEDSQGLRSLLQTPSLCKENHQCEQEVMRICSMPISSCGQVTIEHLIQEEDSDLKINLEEKKPAFEDHGPVLDNLKKSLTKADGNKDVLHAEEFSIEGVNLGVTKNGNLKVVNNEEDSIYLPPVESVAVVEDHVGIPKEATIPHVEERVVTEDISSQEEEEEEEEENADVDDDDDEFDEEAEEEEFSDEKDTEGSDGTGDSSMELNAEAIWPAESLETRETKLCGEISRNKDEEDVEKVVHPELVIGTKKEYEEYGRFESASATKVIMEREKGMCTLVMQMERVAHKSSISKVLFLLATLGLALHFLRLIVSYYLQDSSSNVI